MTPELEKILKSREIIIEELTITTAVMASFHDPDSPILMCIFDMVKLEFIIVSASSKKIIGYDHKEMTNTKLEKYVVQEDLIASIEKTDKNLIQGEESFGFVNYYIHKNGKQKRKLTWFNTVQSRQKSFVIAIPGELTNIEK